MGQKITRNTFKVKDKRDLNHLNRFASIYILLDRVRIKLFQFGADHIFACRHVPAHLQDVRLAAYLAIFDILLPDSCGRIYAGFIPFATACALKSRCHDCFY